MKFDTSSVEMLWDKREFSENRYSENHTEGRKCISVGLSHFFADLG
jgi:hypothetical protein